MVRKLDSQLEICGFESHPIPDENGVKAMSGLIPAPNPGSFNNFKRKKTQDAKGGTPKNSSMKIMEPIQSIFVFAHFQISEVMPE